jgi:hypothetical protein
VDNGAHLHLLVNHFPIIGAFLAVPMLVLALILRKERGLLLASVFLLAVTAVSGWLSIETGEKAMDMLDGQEGKKWFKAYQEGEDALGEHEERAEQSMYAAVPTALLGVVLLVMAHRRPPENPLPRIWIGVLLAGAAATGGAMAYAGNAGGVIMHREIRGDSMDTTVKPKDGEHESGRDK